LSGFRLGSAPDSWGVWFPDDPKQTPWSRYLDEVAEAGYRYTELGPYGYLPTDPDVLRRELDQRGLTVTAGFTMFDLEDEAAWEAGLEQALGTARLVQGLGAEYLIVIDDVYTNLVTGEPRIPAELDDTQWRRLVDTIGRLGALAADHGLKAVVHPHVQTHVETEDEIERLLSDAPDVLLCLDVGHHAYSGGEPIAFFKKHRDRIPYLHLKSVDRELRQRVEDDGTSFADAVAQGVFVEPSVGVVDFGALRDAMADTGYGGFAIVEQDMYPAPFDRPLPIARRSHDYLVGLGL
jgi:inosose dehydratase